MGMGVAGIQALIHGQMRSDVCAGHVCCANMGPFLQRSRVGANETEMHATSHAKVLGVVGNATDICAANTDN